jgi:hypothetical protein
MDGALNHSTYFDIHSNIIIHIFPELPTDPLPLGFPTKFYTCVVDQTLDQFRPAQISTCPASPETSCCVTWKLSVSRKVFVSNVAPCILLDRYHFKSYRFPEEINLYIIVLQRQLNLAKFYNIMHLLFDLICPNKLKVVGRRERQCTRNVIRRSVRVDIVAVEK